MKIAPLMEQFENCQDIDAMLVHTGQHYDREMSQLFFDELGIPQPDINLGVGSASHAAQTAEIMCKFEPVVLEQQPDLVVVVGDVNSTIACGLVAVKLGIKLAHVEAGLRSFDRSMPEEINRVLTDSISDLLFCTEPAAVKNLKNEGVDENKIFLVGNLMIDTLLKHRQRAKSSDILGRVGVEDKAYALLTLHRPSNVDDRKVLEGLVDAFEEIQRQIPIVFPVHPRTRSRLREFGLWDRLEGMGGMRLIEPVGYLDFLRLMDKSRVVFTDSGGIQEETTILGVSCLTLRENTERPVTCEVGTNRIVGVNREDVVKAFGECMADARTESGVPELWDGQAGGRIVGYITG